MSRQRLELGPEGGFEARVPLSLLRAEAGFASFYQRASSLSVRTPRSIGDVIERVRLRKLQSIFSKLSEGSFVGVSGIELEVISGNGHKQFSLYGLPTLEHYRKPQDYTLSITTGDDGMMLPRIQGSILTDETPLLPEPHVQDFLATPTNVIQGPELLTDFIRATRTAEQVQVHNKP